MSLFYTLGNAAGHLAQVTSSGLNEVYLYDESGGRLRKATGTGGPVVFTFYPFAGYEQAGNTVTNHYSFGAVAVAVRSGAGAPSLLYQDGVQSTIYSTNLAFAALG